MKAPLLIVAAILGLSAALTACGSEEEVAPQTTASSTPTATPGPTAQPTTPSPTPAPVPSGWEEYVDAELGFSFPHPPDLSMTTEYFDVTGKDGADAIQRRTISFTRSDGVTAFGVGVEPNPGNLSVEEWARKDGWPSEPEQVTVGGEKGLLFPVNEMGDKYPVATVKHGGMIFIIGGNVFGVPGAGYPAGISEADFQRVLAGFKFGD